MPRRQNIRLINKPPLYREFKPAGIGARFLVFNEITIDEFEAVRLVDYEQMSHLEASEEMGISRPVFTKLLEGARKKIADSLVNGKGLRIIGGHIHFKQNIIKCNSCKQIFEIDIDKSMKYCPSCGSTDLINLAGTYGHGQCCVINLQNNMHYAKQRRNRTRGKRSQNR